MSRGKKNKSQVRLSDRDEQSGRYFRGESLVPVSPGTNWKPSKAAMKAMERMYGKYWREVDFTYHDSSERTERTDTG